MLAGDPCGNRLGALETRRSVEVDTLLATVQIKIAARAGTVGIKVGRKDRATTGAAYYRMGARQIGRSRPKRLGFR